MNKQEFLKELQTRIRILADTEQRDILDEYTQHIDLKISGGLSEEEAIRDFGDIGALAAEILEAYHVKPEFQEEKKDLPDGLYVVNLSTASQWFQKGFAKLGRLFSRIGDGIGRFFRWMFGGIGRFFRWTFGGIGRFFQGCRARLQNREPKKEQEKKEKASMHVSTPLHAVGGAVKTAGGALGRLILALVRLAWNLALLLAAAPIAALGIFALVGCGLTLVLLVQGYPLGGLLLVLLGGVLCCGAVLSLGSGLRWKRTRAETTVAPETEAVLPVEETAISTEVEGYHA